MNEKGPLLHCRRLEPGIGGRRRRDLRRALQRARELVRADRVRVRAYLDRAVREAGGLGERRAQIIVGHPRAGGAEGPFGQQARRRRPRGRPPLGVAARLGGDVRRDPLLRRRCSAGGERRRAHMGARCAPEALHGHAHLGEDASDQGAGASERGELRDPFLLEDLPGALRVRDLHVGGERHAGARSPCALGPVQLLGRRQGGGADFWAG